MPFGKFISMALNSFSASINWCSLCYCTPFLQASFSTPFLIFFFILYILVFTKTGFSDAFGKEVQSCSTSWFDHSLGKK